MKRSLILFGRTTRLDLTLKTSKPLKPLKPLKCKRSKATTGLCQLRCMSNKLSGGGTMEGGGEGQRSSESISFTQATEEEGGYLTWDDPVTCLSEARKLVPPLSSDRYKGQAGKVGVVGGCSEYTGAPYYAAIAALRCGADLAHIFCAKGAAPVIKSYSPELIVHPYLFETDDLEGRPTEDLSASAVEKVSEWLPKLSCVVFGPGLGRDPLIMSTAEKLIHKACDLNIPMVIDADGLWIWNQATFDVGPFTKKNKTVVVTPNAIELKRLMSRYGTRDLSYNLSGNVVVVEKGKEDHIHEGHTDKLEGLKLVARNEGSPRRCGGQGDILSGCIATFLSWGSKGDYPSSWPDDDFPLRRKATSWKAVAAYAGCHLTREASRRAFAKRGRAMLCTDLVDEIGPSFSELFAAD